MALTLARCALEKFGGDSMTRDPAQLQGIPGASEEFLTTKRPTTDDDLHDLSHREVLEIRYWKDLPSR